MRRIYLIASGSHGQLFSIDRGIHFHCAGDNIGIVLTRGVQAFALNHHLAAIHLIAGQIAVLQLRRAGGSVARPALIKPQPLQVMPARLAITTCAFWPATSI